MIFFSIFFIFLSIIGLILVFYNFNFIILCSCLLLLIFGCWSLFVGIRNRNVPILVIYSEGLAAQVFSEYGIIPWQDIKNIDYKILRAGRSTQFYLYIDVFETEKYVTDKQKKFRNKHPFIVDWNRNLSGFGNDTVFAIAMTNIKKRADVVEQIFEEWEGKRLIISPQTTSSELRPSLNYKTNEEPEILKTSSNFKQKLWTGIILLCIVLLGIFGYIQKKLNSFEPVRVNQNYLIIDKDTNITEFGFKVYDKKTTVPLAFVGIYSDFTFSDSKKREVENWKYTFDKMTPEHISEEESFENKVVRMVSITAIKKSKSSLTFDFKHQKDQKQVGNGDIITGWEYAKLDNIQSIKGGYQAALKYKEEGNSKEERVLVLEEKTAYSYINNH